MNTTLRSIVAMVTPSRWGGVALALALLAALAVYLTVDFATMRAWVAVPKSPTFELFGWVLDKIMFMVHVALALFVLFCLGIGAVVVFDMKGKPGEDWQ